MQELERELNQRVKYVVKLSKEIPFYVRKYKELGIDPDEIRSPQDLLKAYEKGLYTTGEDLPQLVYYEDENSKEFFTSATSGEPKRVCMNVDDDKRVVLQEKKFYTNIFKDTDRILNCSPEPPAIAGYMMNCGFSALGYKYTNAPAQKIKGSPQKFMDYYNKFNPTSLLGLTTFLYRLPKMLESIRVNSRELGIRTIITTGEPSSVERRRKIGEEFEADVYDGYGASECGLIAWELGPFIDKYEVTLPETLLFLVKDNNEVSVGETGDVLLTNLYKLDSKPWSALLNYKIGDWAKCLEKNDDGVVTSISEIRREVAAKLHPQEVERYIEKLENYNKELTGEYTLIGFKTVPREVVYKYIEQGIELDEELLEKLRNDPETYKNWDRKSEVEIRVESRKILHPKEKEEISESIREIVYSSNIPVKTLVETTGDARLFIEVENPGELYRGFRKLIKPGKPKRLIDL